ncbi:MAG: tetratricopeptide repeat protein [Methylophilales bacterium]|nr:tetratricopeptide repeat protein [Methylophilales bacterium]
MSAINYIDAVNLYQLGQLKEAEATLRQLLIEQPQHADAWHMLGIVCYQSEKTALAVQHIKQALALDPRNLDYLNNYGLVLRANNQIAEALAPLQQALTLQPKDLDIQLNLGNTYLALDQFEQAAVYYRRIVRVQPNKTDVRLALCHCLTTLGNQAHALGHFQQAETYFQEAIPLNTKDATLHYNLGNAQRELGKAALASKAYQLALIYAPNDADIHNNLGNVQRELGQLDLAIASYTSALRHNPQLHHAKVHLVHQKQHTCAWQDLEKDVQQIREWVNTQPSAQISPFAFLAMAGTSAQEQKTCADNWVNNRYSALIAQSKPYAFSEVQPKQKIKIGYLSADFRLHPLAFLVSELIELHDRQQFEIIAFSYGVNDQSSARARLVKAFDHFHDIRNLSEAESAQKIHDCGIDILVDLTGFTQNSRSGIAALKPAPMSINWLGFPGTMGSLRLAQGQQRSLFNFILSDGFITPETSAHDYAETLALLPDCYQANDRKRPVGKIPSREACGLPASGFVFCCFNQSFKISAEVFALWMRLLKAQDDSVLWLLDCNTWAKQNLIREAELLGINQARLVFAPRVEIADHLARHVHADLFLDTNPYNAHTTCSDALWMGLPLLTCVGDTFASRVAGSLLTAANLTELITYNMQDYENKALYLLNNPEKIKLIKEKLHASKSSVALFDTPRFTKSLENLYQNLWNKHRTFKSKNSSSTIKSYD